jgi:hypothetical protein
MTSEDRKKYSPGQLLPAESAAKADSKLEKVLHDQFINWCHLNEVDFCHSRTDKKATIEVGRSDFLCWKGRYICFVEFKANWGRLSDAQKDFIARQEAKGTPIIVTKSFEKATEFVARNLYLPPWTEPPIGTPTAASGSATTARPEDALT